MVVISFLFGLSFLIRRRLPCAARGRGASIKARPTPRDCYGRRRRLREWRARKKILRRHRRDSGTIVSIEVSGSRTGYTLFIIIRISEPEDYVVQLRTDAGDVIKGKSLIDDGIHADMPSARRIRGEVPDILNSTEGWHRQFGQEDRKCGIRPQAFGMQIQRIHAPTVLPREDGNGRRRVRHRGAVCYRIRSWYQVEAERPLVLCMCSLDNWE